jgi:hypothetical protein
LVTVAANEFIVAECPELSNLTNRETAAILKIDFVTD